MMSRSPIDFDRDRCFELIEMYKQSGMLWNPEHTDYYNKSKKNDAWNEIAANLQCDVNIIKGKMTSLLASFRREKMKTRRSREMGKPRDESRNWFGYKAFSFLLHKKKARITLNTTSLSGNQKESGSSEEEDWDEDLPASCLENKEGEMVRTDTQNNSQTSEACLPQPQQNHKRKRHFDDESKLEEAYKFIKSNVEKDEYAVFGELLATKLRKLDEKLRLFVMHRINNILFEAEMQNCSNVNMGTLSSTTPAVLPDI